MLAILRYNGWRACRVCALESSSAGVACKGLSCCQCPPRPSLLGINGPLDHWYLNNLSPWTIHACYKQSPLYIDGSLSCLPPWTLIIRPLNSSVNLKYAHAQPLPFSYAQRWHHLASSPCPPSFSMLHVILKSWEGQARYHHHLILSLFLDPGPDGSCSFGTYS